MEKSLPLSERWDLSDSGKVCVSLRGFQTHAVGPLLRAEGSPYQVDAALAEGSPYQVDAVGFHVPEEDVGHPLGVPPHAGVIWEIPGRKKHKLETVSNPVQASPGAPVGVGGRGEAAASGGNTTRSGGFGSWPGEGADTSETRLCP